MSNAVLDQNTSSPSSSDEPRTRTTLEIEQKGTIQLADAPDGGLTAWLVATGAAFTFFCGLGFANSFGIFQQYYMSHQLKGSSEDKVAWIGSIAAFLQFAIGAVAGPLFDRYGARVCSSCLVVVVFD